MLESDVDLYLSCITVDKETFVALLDADLVKKKTRYERVAAQGTESRQEFEKFEEKQKEMFDEFLRQQQESLLTSEMQT